jgi:hypothetical protein
VPSNASKSIERRDDANLSYVFSQTSAGRWAIASTTRSNEHDPRRASPCPLNRRRSSGWKIMTEIVDDIEQEIRLRSSDYAILHCSRQR